MDEIVKMEHVYQYNEMMGQETLHPLVSVIDFSKCPKARHARRMYGFYCVFLKDVKCGDMRYGRHYYDYQEGTLVFIAPGQVVGIEDNGEVFQPKGWALLFHPDLIRGTSLGRSMDEYTFFSYEANEALHLSEQERLVVLECLQNITGELNHANDKHSRRLIASNIELLLNYSIRFYERQFITRSEVNKDALSRFERLLNDYFKGDTPQRDGVPSVRWCAEPHCVGSSPNVYLTSHLRLNEALSHSGGGNRSHPRGSHHPRRRKAPARNERGLKHEGRESGTAGNSTFPRRNSRRAISDPDRRRRPSAQRSLRDRRGNNP